MKLSACLASSSVNVYPVKGCPDGKAPVVLKILSVIADTDDFELLKASVVADIFDVKTPRQTTEFLIHNGNCEADVAWVFRSILVGVQGPQFIGSRVEETEARIDRKYRNSLRSV